MTNREQGLRHMFFANSVKEITLIFIGIEAFKQQSLPLILPAARDLAVALMMATIIFLAFTAGADFLWQRYRFAERMKMTKEELKEDYKQSEGDPHVKAKLKQIRAQRSRQRCAHACHFGGAVLLAEWQRQPLARICRVSRPGRLPVREQTR